MKQELTVEELQSLVHARMQLETNRRKKLEVRIQQEIDGKVKESDSDQAKLMETLNTLACEAIARHLKDDQRTVPLLSSSDLMGAVPQLADMILKDEDRTVEAFEATKRKMERSLKRMIDQTTEMMLSMLSSRKDAYEDYWRWVAIARHLAAEQGIPVVELLSQERTFDEITRRVYSREQFTDLTRQAASKFLDADALVSIIVEPLLLMILSELGADESAHDEMRQELEAEVKPGLSTYVEKAKPIVNTWLDEEVERIFSTTA